MTRLAIAAMALLVWVNLAAAAEWERCKVTDPTGTLLNVRVKPNGKITGTLANGTLVAIIESADDANGNPWVRVSLYDEEVHRLGLS